VRSHEDVRHYRREETSEARAIADRTSAGFLARVYEIEAIGIVSGLPYLISKGIYCVRL